MEPIHTRLQVCLTCLAFLTSALTAPIQPGRPYISLEQQQREHLAVITGIRKGMDNAEQHEPSLEMNSRNIHNSTKHDTNNYNISDILFSLTKSQLLKKSTFRNRFNNNPTLINQQSDGLHENLNSVRTGIVETRDASNSANPTLFESSTHLRQKRSDHGQLNICPWKREMLYNYTRLPFRVRTRVCVTSSPVGFHGLVCRPVLESRTFTIRHCHEADPENCKIRVSVSVGCYAAYTSD